MNLLIVLTVLIFLKSQLTLQQGCLNGGSFACQNGGTCNTVTGQCTCSITYTGFFCQTFLGCNLGGTFACQNSGTCRTDGNCNCVIGYGGAYCQSFIGCSAGGQYTCLNGGVCSVSSSGIGTCVCPAGFTGTYCQITIDACISSPCVNGGTCQSSSLIPNFFRCICPLGFTGSNCETGTNYCASFPCKNGAQCVPSTTGYTCSCLTGFFGIDCDKYIGCNPDICTNHGTCQNSSGIISCNCTPGFEGIYCEKATTNISCSCLNGVCDSSSKCVCNNGWYGESCDNSTTALVIGIIIAVIFMIALGIVSIVLYRNRHKLIKKINKAQNKMKSDEKEKRYINSFTEVTMSPPNLSQEQRYINSDQNNFNDEDSINTGEKAVAKPKLPNSPPPILTSNTVKIELKNDPNLNYIDTIDQNDNYYYPNLDDTAK